MAGATSIAKKMDAGGTRRKIRLWTALGENEFDYILAYIREGSFEGLEEIERLRALWTAYCLRKGLTTDKDAYVAKVRKLWHGLQKNGTSEFSGDDYGRFEYIMGGLL